MQYPEVDDMLDWFIGHLVELPPTVVKWRQFGKYALDAANPLSRPAGGSVTRARPSGRPQASRRNNRR